MNTVRNPKLSLSHFVAMFALLSSSYAAQAQCASASNIYSFTHNGKNYEVVRENKTWVSAAACAVLRGGMLAEINDQAEQTAIFTALGNASITNNLTTAPDGGGGAYVWIGGNDLTTEGAWVWNGDNDNSSVQFWQGTWTGNPVGGRYNNWGNEPDDYLGQDALALSLNGWPLGVAGEWNDVDHNNSLYFVIEYDSVACSTADTINVNACYSYTSPSGLYVYTTSNTYTDTLANAAGCDSIITINLTIDSVSDLSTSLAGITITANNSSADASYQWLDCDNGFAVIPGDTLQSFTAMVNGNYAVQITEGGCVDTSACVAINSVGIVENTFGQDFKVYPNPTRGNFSLDLGLIPGEVQITLRDLNGRLIQSQTYSGTALIDMEISEPKGMYILLIQSDDHQAIIKLIKE